MNKTDRDPESLKLPTGFRVTLFVVFFILPFLETVLLMADREENPKFVIQYSELDAWAKYLHITEGIIGPAKILYCFVAGFWCYSTRSVAVLIHTIFAVWIFFPVMYIFIGFILPNTMVDLVTSPGSILGVFRNICYAMVFTAMALYSPKVRSVFGLSNRCP